MTYVLSLLLCCFSTLALAQAQTTPTAKPADVAPPKEDAKPAAQKIDGSAANLSDSSLKYECKNGKNIRRIEIVFDDPQTKTPCRVQYTKETENPGVTETLWNANNDFNFCEEKASAFVSKIESLNWTCTGQ